MNYFNEVIKDILEINLKVKTDNKEERNISFSNFKKPKCPSVDLYSDKTTENPIKQIKINMDCDSFDLYITENDGWIPVGERLPENDYEVLITYWDKENHSDKHVGITSCREVHFGGKSLGYKDWYDPFQYFSYSYEIIAWMPLPKPYSRINS
jgi:hypothetical protein